MRWWVGALRGLNARISERVILVVGWVAFLVYAFPGFMSYDSVWQLIQARGIEPVNDWHPPLMAVIWRYFNALIAGPFLMLALQSLSFLLGLYFIGKRFMRPRTAAIVAAAVLVVPMNLIVMAVIWKDSQMAGFLVASVAALLSPSRRVRFVGCLFLFLATAFRYNAAAATLPILVFLWDRRDEVRWSRRWLVAAGMWVAITVFAFVINGLLTDTKAHAWPTASAPVDIVGVVHFANRLDNAKLLRDTEGVPWIWKDDKVQIHAHTLYKPENSFLETTQGPRALINYPTTDAERVALSAAWKKLVLDHPFAYFRHRLAVFGVQLNHEPKVWAGFTNETWAEDLLHYRLDHASVQLSLVRVMEHAVKTIAFRVRVYFLLALLLLPLARRNRAALAFLLSGLLYELGLFIVAPAIDYRYSHWLVVSTIIGTILLVASRVQRRVERTAQRTAAALVPDTP